MGKKLSTIISGVHFYQIVYRIHATKRMFERDIDENEIYVVLTAGEIIEEYPDDFPFPSFLINGKTNKNRYLHIVVGIDEVGQKLYVITTYEPDSLIWAEDFSRRK